MLFIANDGVYGHELHRTDGTGSNTYMIRDLVPGSLGIDPDITIFRGIAYVFGIGDNAETWLFRSDGTYPFKSIYPLRRSYFTSGYLVFNNFMYFQVWTNGNTFELWSTDGVNDTKIVYKGPSGTDGTMMNPPTFLTPFNNDKLIMAMDDSIHGCELWITKGAPNTTKLILDIIPGPESSYPSDFIEFKNKIYFIIRNGTKFPFFVTDGSPSGTKIVKEIDIYAYTSNAMQPGIIIYHNYLYFRAKNNLNSYGINLWRSDGSTDGTVMLSGLGYHVYTLPFVFQDKLYYLGGVTGQDKDTVALYINDGITKNIQMVRGMCGNFSQVTLDCVEALEIVSNKLFIGFSNATYGTQLYCSV